MSDNHTEDNVYGPSEAQGSPDEHSVPRSGPPHAGSPDRQPVADDYSSPEGQPTTAMQELEAQPLDAVAVGVEENDEATAHTANGSQHGFTVETSPHGDIYTQDPADAYYQEHQTAHGHDYETYANSEEKAAAMVRSAAIDPDISAVPELAPLAGGGWDGPPSNGYSPGSIEPWQPAPDPQAPLNDKEMDLFEHLAELRIRLLRSFVAIGLAMCGTWAYGDPISDWFAWPIREALKRYAKGHDGGIVTLDATEGFMVFFQISLVSALLLVMPYVLYELWSFVEPALTNKERRYTMVLLPFSIGLFFIGCIFGYYISPLFFKFFLNYQPAGSKTYYGYSTTVLLLAKMLLVFGIAFQVPVVTIFVNKIGLVSRNVLIEYWRHVVVVIFTVVSIITPTWDPLTLLMCSVPPCILYVLSIWLVKWL